MVNTILGWWNMLEYKVNCMMDSSRVALYIQCKAIECVLLTWCTDHFIYEPGKNRCHSQMHVIYKVVETVKLWCLFCRDGCLRPYSWRKCLQLQSLQ